MILSVARTCRWLVCLKGSVCRGSVLSDGRLFNRLVKYAGQFARSKLYLQANPFRFNTYPKTQLLPLRPSGGPHRATGKGPIRFRFRFVIRAAGSGWPLRPLTQADWAGRRSQTRQNSFISSGLPKETRTKVFIEGNRRAMAMLCLRKCSMTSVARRWVCSIAKLV
jgi:hypothetical protein